MTVRRDGDLIRTPIASPDRWDNHARCATLNTSMLLPEVELTHRGSTRTGPVGARLKLVCHQCPVQTECRTWALTYPDPATDHIAGGLTPRERSDIRKRRPHTYHD